MKTKGRRIAITTGLVTLVLLAFAVFLGWPHLRSWYRFWQLFEYLGVNAQGYPEYRHRQTGIVFVSLPGGKFWMGAQIKDPKGPNYDPGLKEDPVHEVTLSPFLIAKYEMSQTAWEHVMGRNPSKFVGDELPVEQVSWEECQEFCRRTGLKLPTEAQWEYACRAGAPGPYAGTGELKDMGWFDGNSGIQTHPVGKKLPNRFGLHDMHGNIFEWCEDVYNESFYSTPEAVGLDPVCTSGSDYRVTRSGAFNYTFEYARCAYRYRFEAWRHNLNFGFRVVASPFSSNR